MSFGSPQHWFVLAFRIDNEKFEILESQLVGSEDKVLAGGMGIGRPGHRFEMSHLTNITSIEFHGEDIRDQ